MAKNALPQKAVDLSKWYLAVIEQAKLADYAPVKGCMVFRPQAYAIWENLAKAINNEFAQAPLPGGGLSQGSGAPRIGLPGDRPGQFRHRC